MGYLSILLGFIVLVVLCIKHINVMIAAFAAAATVVFLAGLPITESLITVYFERFGMIAASLAPMFLFGAILAKIYTYSGASETIANSVCNALFKYAKTDKTRYALGFLSVIIAAAILCYGGINAAVALIAIYPIALKIFEKAGIPKRFIMGAICGGAFTFALSGPGSPQPTNVVAMTIGTSSSVGFVAGTIAAIVEIIVMVAILTHMCLKATNKGETFSFGPKDKFRESGLKGPNFLLSMIPLVTLLIIFNILKVNISLAILITAILSAVLFYGILGKDHLLKSINEGAVSSLIPVGAICSVNGFAAVVQSVPEYQKLIDGLLGASISPVIMLILCVAVICMMTGGSTTGTQIALPILAPVLTKMGLSLPFIHRVGVYAATTLDSLPISGSVIMAVELADLKMKDGYPPVFVSTVLATTAGTAVVTLIMLLLPNLP